MGNLRKLEPSDLLNIPTDDGNKLVVTKIEVANIIRTFIHNEIGNLPDEIYSRYKDDLSEKINKKISLIEKELDAFIEHKFNLLAEKTCELLISRKFNEEVEKKAEERAEQLLLQKLKKGKF